MTPAEQQLLAEWLECSPGIVTDELVDALIAIQDNPELLSLWVLDFVYPYDEEDEDDVTAQTCLGPHFEMTFDQMMKIPTPAIAHIWQLESDKLALKLGVYPRHGKISLQP